MGKRGQVTVFVIVGIVIVALILLFLFLRTRVQIGPITIDNLEDQLEPIREHIEECMLERAELDIIRMGEQGGFLTTPIGTFREYQGKQVSYLCYNIKDQPFCRSRVLTLKMMEEELTESIKQIAITCLRVEQFRKSGITLDKGELDINVDIGEDTVVVEATLPVKLIKDDLQAEMTTYSVSLDYPLGRLYEAMRDIVNSEAVVGNFDAVPYVLQKTQLHNKPYIISCPHGPYPDKHCMLKIKDVPSEESEYIFQFFIQGEAR